MTLDIRQVFKATVVVIATVFGAYVIFTGAEIILTLLLAIIIASAVRPALAHLNRLHIPEGISIILIYGVLAIFVIFVFFVILPPMFNQFALYIEQDWRLASRIIQAQQFVEIYLSDVTNEDITLVSSNQIEEAVAVFLVQFRSILPRLLQNAGSLLVGGILIFIMGAYWLTAHDQAKNFLLELVSPKYREQTSTIIDKIEITMGRYVRGIVIISAIVGVLVFVPLYVLDVPNSLTLAFIIGVLTMIPVVGGMVGGAIAFLLTLTIEPEKAIIVLIVYLIVNQIENYLLQPRIMSGEVGLNPLLVIIYTSIGFLLSGFIGALVAVPAMGAVHILLEHLVIIPHRKKVADDMDSQILITKS
ncbi:MAG: AI-2E family transporter [Chloroflexota bacterium]